MSNSTVQNLLFDEKVLSLIKYRPPNTGTAYRLINMVLVLCMVVFCFDN